MRRHARLSQRWSGHWFVCDDHKTKWWVGSNLFDGWRYQDEETWRKNERILAGYTAVKSLDTHERDGRELVKERAEAAAQLLADFLSKPRSGGER